MTFGQIVICIYMTTLFFYFVHLAVKHFEAERQEIKDKGSIINRYF